MPQAQAVLPSGAVTHAAAPPPEPVVMGCSTATLEALTRMGIALVEGKCAELEMELHDTRARLNRACESLDQSRAINEKLRAQTALLISRFQPRIAAAATTAAAATADTAAKCSQASQHASSHDNQSQEFLTALEVFAKEHYPAPPEAAAAAAPPAVTASTFTCAQPQPPKEKEVAQTDSTHEQQNDSSGAGAESGGGGASEKNDDRGSALVNAASATESHTTSATAAAARPTSPIYPALPLASEEGDGVQPDNSDIDADKSKAVCSTQEGSEYLVCLHRTAHVHNEQQTEEIIQGDVIVARDDNDEHGPEQSREELPAQHCNDGGCDGDSSESPEATKFISHLSPEFDGPDTTTSLACGGEAPGAGTAGADKIPVAAAAERQLPGSRRRVSARAPELLLQATEIMAAARDNASEPSCTITPPAAAARVHITGFAAKQKAQLAAKLRRLMSRPRDGGGGGDAAVTMIADVLSVEDLGRANVTHVIAPLASRNMKKVAAIASGLWVCQQPLVTCPTFVLTPHLDGCARLRSLTNSGCWTLPPKDSFCQRETTWTARPSLRPQVPLQVGDYNISHTHTLSDMRWPPKCVFKPEAAYAYRSSS
jgi:hypothetical protein